MTSLLHPANAHVCSTRTERAARCAVRHGERVVLLRRDRRLQGERHDDRRVRGFPQLVPVREDVFRELRSAWILHEPARMLRSN